MLTPRHSLNAISEPHLDRALKLVDVVYEQLTATSKINSQHLLTFTIPNVLPGWGSEKAFNKDLRVSKFVPSLSAEFQNAAIKPTFYVLVAIRPILHKKLKKRRKCAC